MSTLPVFVHFGRFLAYTRIAERDNLTSFSPPLGSDQEESMMLTPGFVWMNRPDLDVFISGDGSESVSLALMPGTLVSDTWGLARGFAGQVSFRTNFDEEQQITANFRLSDSIEAGAVVEIIRNDRVIAGHTWPVTSVSSENNRDAALSFVLESGKQQFTVQTRGGRNWVHFDSLSIDRKRPVLAAAGRRNDAFIAVWIWHRQNIFSIDSDLIPARAILRLAAVPPGNWQINRWNTTSGEIQERRLISHPGGDLELVTPEIYRHTVIVLERPDIP